MRYLSLVMLALMLGSCGTSKNKTVEFRIKEGKHRSRPYIYVDPEKANGIEFTFTTDNSWIFTPPTNNGWSKLFGVAAGWNAHRNSARFVFVNNDEGLFLGGYCYHNKTTPQENTDLKSVIAPIFPDKIYRARLIRDNGEWLFTFFTPENDTVTWSCPCGDMKKRLWVYKPYMGGTYTIGQDWNTTIEYRWIY